MTKPEYLAKQCDYWVSDWQRCEKGGAVFRTGEQYYCLEHGHNIFRDIWKAEDAHHLPRHTFVKTTGFEFLQ